MNSSHPCRRHALRLLASAAGAALLPAAWAQKRPGSTAVELWKDASCGCCEDWITHMKQHGFTVTAHDTGNNAVRARWGWRCRACRSARPAWTARCTAAGATNTTRCWCCATAAAGCSKATVEYGGFKPNRLAALQPSAQAAIEIGA